MGNYFSGSLDLFIDHTKISCTNLVKIARQFQNENLSFQFNFAWNDKYFESKGFDNIFHTIQIYDYDKALGCNEEGGLSEDSKQFEDFLISIDFPLDLLEHDYYINYRDWMDDSRSDQYLSDFMVEAIDNIKNKNEVFRCFYIEVYCNTKHYKDTNCECSIFGLINSLKEYRYLVGEAKEEHAIVKAQERQEILEDIERVGSMLDKYEQAMKEAKEISEMCEKQLLDTKKEMKDTIQSMKDNMRVSEAYKRMDKIRADSGTDRMIAAIHDKNEELSKMAAGSRAVYQNSTAAKVRAVEKDVRHLESDAYLDSLRRKYSGSSTPALEAKSRTTMSSLTRVNQKEKV